MPNPSAAESVPAVTIARGPARSYTRPASGAATSSGSVIGSMPSPASIGVKPRMSWVKIAPKIVSPISANWAKNRTSVSPRKLRTPNRRSSTSGAGARRSITTNAISRTVPPASSATVRGEPQPQLLASISASTSAASPGTSVTRPGMSIRPPASTRPSGRVQSTIAIVAAPTGMLIQNTQRQSRDSVNTPPISGPRERKIIDRPA